MAGAVGGRVKGCGKTRYQRNDGEEKNSYSNILEVKKGLRLHSLQARNYILKI